MDYVDLQRRREGRVRARQKPEASRPGATRGPLFLLGTGFALGTFASFVLSASLMFSMGWVDPVWLLFLFVFPLMPLLFSRVRRFLGRDAEPTGPSLGSEKQLLLAILDSGGSTTPVEAALRTSLTVDEAEEILTRFADRGHLVVESRDGALFYTLPGRRKTPETRTV